jgi:hypothetical protein
MKHETLHLNPRYVYVLVNNTWYDTHAELNPKVGQSFLNGQIQEILDYQSYIEKYPEAKDEMYSYVSEKTIHGGYIRRVVNSSVKYAINPATSMTSNVSVKDYE